MTKSDLLDRGIIMKLEAISRSNRLTEKEVWDRFEAMRPQVLGAMFAALSAAMRRWPEAESPAELPRLADFAQWGAVIAEALDYTTEEFLNAYGVNVETQNEAALEASAVGLAILGFLGKRSVWEGTASELLAALVENAESLRIDTKSKEWPSQPNVLSRRIREVAPNLRSVGVSITERKSRGAKIWELDLESSEDIDLIDPIDPQAGATAPDEDIGESTPGSAVSTPQSHVSTPVNAQGTLGNASGVDGVDVSTALADGEPPENDEPRKRMSL